MNIEALNEGYRLMQEQLTTVDGDFVLEETKGDPIYI